MEREPDELWYTAELARERNDEMEEIGKSLPRVLRPYLRRERPLVVEVLAPLWAQIVGPGVAPHAHPTGFSAGTLTVETSCEVWARQLGELREEIRAAINSSLGLPVVRRLVVRRVSRGGTDKVAFGLKKTEIRPLPDASDSNVTCTAKRIG